MHTQSYHYFYIEIPVCADCHDVRTFKYIIIYVNVLLHIFSIVYNIVF